MDHKVHKGTSVLRIDVSQRSDKKFGELFVDGCVLTAFLAHLVAQLQQLARMLVTGTLGAEPP